MLIVTYLFRQREHGRGGERKRRERISNKLQAEYRAQWGVLNLMTLRP